MESGFFDVLILSLLAGLATGLGRFVVMLRRPGEKLLGFLMGLVAGIMVTLLFLELASQAMKISGLLLVTLGFLVGSFDRSVMMGCIATFMLLSIL